jgi:hypothetical protein
MCVAVKKLEEAQISRYVQWRLVVSTAFCLWNQLHKLHSCYSFAVTDVYMYRVPDGLTAHERFRVRKIIPYQVARAFGIPRSARLGYRMRNYDDQGPRHDIVVDSPDDSDGLEDEFQCPCHDCGLPVVDLTVG